jgi:hypothetical protein
MQITTEQDQKMTAAYITFKLEDGSTLTVLREEGESTNHAVSRKLTESLGDQWIADLDNGNEQDEDGEWLFTPVEDMTASEIADQLRCIARDYLVEIVSFTAYEAA